MFHEPFIISRVKHHLSAVLIKTIHLGNTNDGVINLWQFVFTIVFELTNKRVDEKLMIVALE